jgi:hypothetical protein
MRNKRRLGVVFALAATVALAAAGSAIATTSSVSFSITPTNPHGTFKPSKLFVNTHTEYDSGTFPGTFTNRTQLFFDKNMQINQGAVPVKCTDAQMNLGNATMQQAMNANCTGGKARNALVGTGTAQANAVSEGDSKACVLAFNRAPNGILLFTRVQTLGNISCLNANTNTAGNVTVVLKAPLSANPASTSPGGSLPGAFYGGGKKLDFNNITAVAGLPLRDFKVTTGKGAPQTNLTGTKANFIKAKCTQRAGLGTPAKKWVMRAIFTYNNGPSSANLNPSQVLNVKKGPCT